MYLVHYVLLEAKGTWSTMFPVGEHSGPSALGLRRRTLDAKGILDAKGTPPLGLRKVSLGEHSEPRTLGLRRYRVFLKQPFFYLLFLVQLSHINRETKGFSKQTGFLRL